jgi:hypothetical protein
MGMSWDYITEVDILCQAVTCNEIGNPKAKVSPSQTNLISLTTAHINTIITNISKSRQGDADGQREYIHGGHGQGD